MAHQLETTDYSALLLPDVGSKLASFRSRHTGFEYLWQPPSGDYPRPQYGQVYGPEFATGFDECLPTLLACPYPAAPWEDAAVPDHGEVWSLPWHADADGGAVRLAISGRVLPYRLEKTVQAEGESALLFRYHLTNEGTAPLRWLWSAHPLFNVTKGLEVHIPGRPALSVYESLGNALGKPGSVGRWPDAGGVDLVVPARREPAAEKVFLSGLREGRIGLRYADIGEDIEIEFSADVLTGIGLWYNVRGWPVDAPHCNAGIEPCSEPYESLTDCRNLLAPGDSIAWWMRWRLFRWVADGRDER
ncbi:MAG: aldose epimerase family protein [Anaerolineae bacterium]